MTRSPLALAIVAAAAVFAWWSVTVHVNYQSNWTALFCTGDAWKLPPELDAGTYRFANSKGYDGQFYRLAAHDPALLRGYRVYADAAALRWRRILVPGLAWALALGNDNSIDGAYIFLILFSAGAGVYAMSLWLTRRGWHPAGGLLFLVLPGTLISIDRMTVDIALYALLFACLLLAEDGRDAWLWVALAACPLVRDLGVLVIAGFLAVELIARRYRRAAWIGSTLLPAALWFLYVRGQLASHITSPLTLTPEVAPWAFRQCGYGIFVRIFSPTQYPLPPLLATTVQVLDVISLLGVVLCVGVTLARFRWRTATPVQWIAFAFSVLYFAASSHVFWRDLYSWARAYTPALGLLAVTDDVRLSRLRWLPLLAVSGRVLFQFGAQLEGIVRSLIPR